MRKTGKQEKKACRSEFQLLLPFLLSSFPDSFSSARFLDLRDESVKVRPFAGIEFGVEQFAIGADFEGAATRRNEGERRDPIAELENFGRQTDGLGRVVSNAAILDPDFGFHRSLLSRAKLTATESGSSWRRCFRRDTMKNYSARRAMIGLTRVARRAGTKQDAAATAVRSAATVL